GFIIHIYPNPVLDWTNLQINLPQASELGLSLYNINGKVIYQANYNYVEKGESNFPLDFETLDEGVYFLSVQSIESQRTIRIVIL
ncbi:MAG: T9SS type A sorting domain-containing protein, partial [Bacteroidota bacterium]